MIEFVFDRDEYGESGPDTGPQPPIYSAYNGHEEGRYPRLYATFGAACTTVRLLSKRYQNAWDGAVLSLHDHKGGLTVTWRDRTARIMFEGVVMGAWEGQGEHSGEHKLPQL